MGVCDCLNEHRSNVGDVWYVYDDALAACHAEVHGLHCKQMTSIHIVQEVSE